MVTGENGSAYASADDGQSFQILPLNLGMAVFGVTQASNGDLIFIGSAGVRANSSIGIERYELTHLRCKWLAVRPYKNTY